MMPDKELLMSNAQAFSSDAGSTNVINLLKTGRRLANGTPLAVVIQVTVAADFTTGDELYEFEVQTDDDEAFGSATELVARSIVAGSLTLASLHTIPLPVELVFEKFMRIRIDVSGTTPSVTISAWLAPIRDVENWTAYASGFTVS